MESTNEPGDALDEEPSTEATGATGAYALLPAPAGGKKQRRLREAVKLALEPQGGAPNPAALVKYGETGIASSTPKAGKRHARRNEDLYDTDYEIRSMLQDRRLDDDAQEDIHGMAQAAKALLAPRHHIRIDELEEDEDEATFQEDIVRRTSKNSSWYERTTSAMWVKPFGVARKYQKTISVDTEGMMRANMRYDSLSIRLGSGAAEDSSVLVKSRFVQRTGPRFSHGRSDQDYAVMRRFMESENRAPFRRNGSPGKRMSGVRSMAGKLGYALVVIIKLALTIAAVVTAAIGVVVLLAYIQGEPVLTNTIFWQVITNGWLHGLFALMVLIAVRRIMFRFSDKKIP